MAVAVPLLAVSLLLAIANSGGTWLAGMLLAAALVNATAGYIISQRDRWP